MPELGAGAGRLFCAHLADFGGDGEARGHVEAQVGHLAEVCALAAQLHEGLPGSSER